MPRDIVAAQNSSENLIGVNGQIAKAAGDLVLNSN
jgi:hypothetical protein